MDRHKFDLILRKHLDIHLKNKTIDNFYIIKEAVNNFERCLRLSIGNKHVERMLYSSVIDLLSDDKEEVIEKLVDDMVKELHKDDIVFTIHITRQQILETLQKYIYMADCLDKPALTEARNFIGAYYNDEE